MRYTIVVEATKGSRQAEPTEQLFAEMAHQEQNVMQKITPCLWFDSEAEDAARFYTSILDRAYEQPAEESAR